MNDWKQLSLGTIHNKTRETRNFKHFIKQMQNYQKKVSK